MSFWQPTENKEQRRLRLLNWRKDGLTNKQRHAKQKVEREKLEPKREDK